MTSPPLRIGILGAANTARAFAAGVAPAERATIAAVASRDAAKAAQFAGEFAIPTSLGSYEALLADPSIDAIYNPAAQQPACRMDDQSSQSRQTRAV